MTFICVDFNLRYAKNFPLSYNFTVGHQVSQQALNKQ